MGLKQIWAVICHAYSPGVKWTREDIRVKQEEVFNVAKKQSDFAGMMTRLVFIQIGISYVWRLASSETGFMKFCYYFCGLTVTAFLIRFWLQVTFVITEYFFGFFLVEKSKTLSKLFFTLIYLTFVSMLGAALWGLIAKLSFVKGP